MRAQILLLGTWCFCFNANGQNSYYLNSPLSQANSIDWNNAEEQLHERKEYSAVFHFPDGKVISKNSYSPIHFKNEKGEWAAITANFRKTNDEWIFDQQKMPIVISSDGYITLNANSLQSVSYMPAAFKNNFDLNNLSGENGDFIYLVENEIQKIQVRNNAIKSSYVLQSAPNDAANEWVLSERMRIPSGVKHIFNTEKGSWKNNLWYGEIQFVNESNEVISNLGGAVCIDGSGEFCLAGYSIHPISKNEIELKIHVSRNWLTDVTRNYPVEIDPLITGPTSLWNGGYMPSCFMPQYNVDSLQVNVPGGVTVTGLLVQASYYADPFTAAWMSDGSMYFSTECGQTDEFTVTGANANLAGTAYLQDYDMRNPLMCCFVPTCGDQNFYLRMHLGRSFINDGCNINYIYYDQFSLWPFTAYIEGHTIETFGSEWSVPNGATCTNDCSVTGTIRMKYGVPPYTITHPWMQGSIVTGTATPCNIGNTSKQVPLDIPNCPDFCNTSPTLSIPPPTVTDACGSVIIGLIPDDLNRKPAPDIQLSPQNLVVCNNEPFDVSVSSCLSGANITWAGNGQSGTGSFTSQFFTPDTLSIDVSFNAFAELNGCYSDTVQYLVNVQPSITAFYAATPNPVVVNTELTLADLSNAYSVGIQNSNWDMGNGSALTGASVNYIYDVPGNYNVCLTTTSDQNCTAEICDIIQVVPATITPINIITPNGDDLNDILEFQYLEFYPQNKLEVFNRWGIKIFEAEPYLNNWSADDYADGTYFYVLRVNESQTVESDLLIKRN